MKRLTPLLVTVVYLGLCSSARSEELPQIDFDFQCRFQGGGDYKEKKCLAREEDAARALYAKWAELPNEIQKNCYAAHQRDTPVSYTEIAACVQHDLAFDDKQDTKFVVEDRDLAPFPRWDVSSGCRASLSKLGMDGDVAICIGDANLAKVRLALYWDKVEEEHRYRCLSRAAAKESYDLLGACIEFMAFR